MAQCGVAPRAAAAAVLPTPRVASRGVDGGKARAPPRRLRAFGRTARDAFPRVFQPGTGRQRQRGRPGSSCPGQRDNELRNRSDTPGTASDNTKRLDKATSVVDQYIEEQAVRSKEAGKRSRLADLLPGEDGQAPGRWTSFSAKSQAQQVIMEPVSSFSGLKEYLALPVEEYSLLDPMWIEKLDGEDVFHFRVPLEETGMSLRLTPQTWVKVDINTEKEEVRFSSNRLKLGDGELDEVLEARLRFEFDSRLSYRPVRKYKKAGDVPDKGLRVTRVMQARQADRTVKDAHVGNGNGRDGTDSQRSPSPGIEDFSPTSVHELQLDVSIKIEMKLPPKSVAGSGLFLKGAGKLILKAALQALAPSFVRLVAEDYKRWVTRPGKREQREAVGSLVDVTPDAS